MKTRARLFSLYLALVPLLLVTPSLSSHASAPAGRYTIANGTVLDTKTTLTWQQTISTTKYSWTDAQTYCSTLSLNGTGWRLPSVRELMTLVDFTAQHNPGVFGGVVGGAPIDATAFPNTPNDAFWTSSAFAHDATQAWSVAFFGGYSSIFPVTNTNHVRCVR